MFVCFFSKKVRKASAEDTPPPGVSDEEIEAQIIEDSLAPPDDPVEGGALSKIVGLEVVKAQIRGLRRTLETTVGSNGVTSTTEIPMALRHLALVGNPGTGKQLVARIWANVLFTMGVVNRHFVVAGRDDFVDRKSEARTVFKTRRVLERAAGGVLYIPEPYQLLPSAARPRGSDHGAAALRELTRALPPGNPIVILAGVPLDLQRILSSDIGFKSHFLTRLEFPDLTPEQIARIFLQN